METYKSRKGLPIVRGNLFCSTGFFAGVPAKKATRSYSPMAAL